MHALLRHPAIHFLAAGAAIFAAVRWSAPADTTLARRHRIVIDTAAIDDIRSRHTARHGKPPTAAEVAALIDATVVEEMLVREALARDLDVTDAVVERRLVQNMRFLDSRTTDESLLLRQAAALGLRDGDPVIRRRLVQRMRTVLSRPPDASAPTLAELRSYYASHRDRFAPTPRVRLSQVFFAGDDAAQRAAATLADLRAAASGADVAARFGDPFIAGNHLPPQSERGLAKIFGATFAHRSLSLPQGVWSEPVASSFGIHLVWIHARESGQTPDFDTVRETVRRRLEAERAQAALQRGIEELRAHYVVEIDRTNVTGGTRAPH